MNTIDKIKDLIEKEDITIYELAKRSDIPPSTISNALRRSNTPSISTLTSICKGLNITMSEFFAEGEFNDLTLEEKTLLEKWQTLSKEQKQAILSIIDLF